MSDSSPFLKKVGEHFSFEILDSAFRQLKKDFIFVQYHNKPSALLNLSGNLLLPTLNFKIAAK